MLRSLLALAVVLGTAASCSAGFSRADAVDAFLTKNPDATTAEAACVIDALIEEYEGDPVDESDLEGLEAELLADPQRERFVLDQFRAEFGCGLTDDVEAQLVSLLELSGALDAAGDDGAVDCVAAELASIATDRDLQVLIDGQMSDSFFETFFDAVVACDALPGS